MSARQGGVYFVVAFKDEERHYWAANSRDRQSAILAIQNRLGPDWEVRTPEHFRLGRDHLEALDLGPGMVRRIKYIE